MNNVPTHFISHSEKDALLSAFVQNLIEKNMSGVTVATTVETFNTASGSVIVGDQFKEKILSAINQSSFIVLIVTKNFFDSVYCVSELGVSWSFEYGSSQLKKKIIPLFFDKEGEDSFLKSPLSHIQGMKIETIEHIQRFIDQLKSFSDDDVDIDISEEKYDIDCEENKDTKISTRKQIEKSIDDNTNIKQKYKEMYVKYGKNFSQGIPKYSGWFTIHNPKKSLEGKEYITFCLIIDQDSPSTWKYLIIPKKDFFNILEEKVPDKNGFHHFYISYKDDDDVCDTRNNIINLSKYLVVNSKTSDNEI